MNTTCQKIRQAITASLGDRELEVRIVAIELLAKTGMVSPEVIEETITQTNWDGYVSCLFYGLARAGYVSPLSISLACDRLIHGDEYEKAAALSLLRKSKDKTTIPVLMQVAREKNLPDRDVVDLIRAIGEIGDPHIDAIGFLNLMRQSENFGIKTEAAVALARLGFRKEAVSFLQDLMQTGDVNQRIKVACRLIDLGEQDLAYPVLLEILRNYSEYCWLAAIDSAVQYSGFLRSYKSTVVPHLRKIAQEGVFWTTRLTAFDSLAAIEANDRETINVCRDALREPDCSLQIKALRTLICLGAATPDDVKKLDLQHRHARQDLLQDLQTVDRKVFSREVVEAIASLLDRCCSNDIVTQRILLHLGVVREGALDYLLLCLSDPSSWLRGAALYALSEMWFVAGCQAE